MSSILKAARDALAPIFTPGQTTIDGITPGSWASPQNPIRPIPQLAMGLRTWDYTPAINLQFTPRGDVPISFQQLWSVSNSFDLCRLVIEARKNRIANRPWVIRVKTQPGERKKDRLAREQKTPNVARLTALFQYPDGYYPFDKWIRMWAEQMLVFDAATVAPIRNVLGDIFHLRIIDGATITPLIDNYGFVPAPPSPAFQQIILGIPSADMIAGGWAQTKDGKAKKEYTVDTLVYSKKNPRVNSRWGYSPVEQMIVTLGIASNRQTFLKEYYQSGNVPEGVMYLPEGWSSQQIKDHQTWFDSLLAGNLARRRRILMAPETKQPVSFSKQNALTDGTDEYLIRVVAFAFGESPANLVKQVGHQSTNKEQNDTSEEMGLESDLKHIETEMNRIIDQVMGAPDVEFAFADAEEVDPLKKSQIDVAYVGAGIYNRDEVREANGDDPLPIPQGAMFGINTATGFVPLDAPPPQQGAGDGEDDEDPDPGSERTPANRGTVKLRKNSLRLVGGDLTPRSRQAREHSSRVLRKFLKDQSLRVGAKAAAEFQAAKSLRLGGLSKGDTEEDTARALAILTMLEWDYPTLYRQLLPYLEMAAEEGAKTGAYQVAANAGADLNETLNEALAAAKRAADERSAQMVGLKVQDDGTVAEATGAQWAISTTAKDDVLAAIQQAIVEEWSPDQLEAVIQAATIFQPDHADLIADAEVSRQQAGGHLLSWRASGMVLEYAWTVQDIGCCPQCASYSALGSVPVGYEFAPMIYAPGAHPNCRCWLTATKLKGQD